MLPTVASAHSFGSTYQLPIPFWLYAYGAAAALLLSFLVVAWFAGVAPERETGARTLTWLQPGRVFPERSVVHLLRLLSVAALALTIVSGFIGTQSAYHNFNMTFFWIVCVLGLGYLSAIVGPLCVLLNPLRVLCETCEGLPLRREQPRLRYPPSFGYYPALFLYFVFIWLELFGQLGPRALSIALLVYSALNLAGAWLFGTAVWFRYCELFSVLFGVLARIAPVDAQRIGDRTVPRLRPPFAGLLEARVEHFSLLLFVLFMLASTAFDGLHETAPWVRAFWVDLYGVLSPSFGGNIVETYGRFKLIYVAYQTLGLLLLPLAYLLIYLGFVAWAKRLGRSSLSVRDLALRFTGSLVPIALAYSLAHYFTLLLIQAPEILRLASDPFGYGWNLFGTATTLRRAANLNAATVWQAQVALIVVGHIVSVWLAHVEALRLLPTRRAALLSQLPMLLLMMAYTTSGLWILSAPINPAIRPGG